MDGRVAEHRVTAGCDQRQLEDSHPADEAAQALTRTRSFKPKQLVRSQAIRESQSPPRLPSPLVPASPEHPSKQGAEPPQPNIIYNNSKSDIVVSSSAYCNVSLNSCVSSFNSDVRTDASRVVCARMATNSSQNDTQKISGRNLRMDGAEGKCQQAGVQRPVEIQITSGTWDSMVYEEDDASILQESGLDDNGGGGSTSMSRMECVCGHCEGFAVKIGASNGVCPDCQCRIRTRARCCPAKQDSGVGCCSDECPDCASEHSEPDASTGSELLSSIHRSTKVSSGNEDSKQDSLCADDDAQGSDDGQYEQGSFCRCQVKNGHQMQRNDSEDGKLEPQGAELVRFIRCTLNKNRRDRIVLLKIERELATLVNDTSRCTAKFPTMSSYHRMLVHRCAALFGLKHLLDPTSRLAVIVTKTGTSGGRIPCTGFRQWCSVQFPVSPGRYQQDMPQAKSILKRDTHSLDEVLSGSAGPHSASARSKSFEQREEEYERVRRRIFSGDEAGNGEDMGWPWLQEGGRPQPPVKLLTPDCGGVGRQNRLLKVQSLETREPPSAQTMRAAVSKSHSFGGYGGVGGDRGSPPGLTGPPARILSRQGDLASSSWRLSPSSSGYKTLSLRSTDSITPSPTDHTPEPAYDAAQPTAPVLWAVTDMAAIPPGALIIHPQTGQPLTNADGSLYHYDPARPPRLPPHSPGALPSSTQNGMVNTAQDKKNEWVAEKRRGRLEKQNSINASDYDCPSTQEYQKNCCQPHQETENYQQYCANCPQPGDQDLQYANMQKPSVIVTDSVTSIQNVDSKPNTINSKSEIESNNNNYQMTDSAIGYAVSSGFDGKPDEAMYGNMGAQFCQQEYEAGPLGYKGSEVMFQERKEGEGMVQYSVYYHHSNGGFQQPNAPDYVDGQNQVYRGNEEQVVQNAPGMFCVPENETNLPLTALQVKASQYQAAGLVPHNPQMYPADVDIMRQQVALASGAMMYTGPPPAPNYAQQHCRIDPSLPQLYNPGVAAQSGSEQQQQQPPAAPKPSLSPEAGGCGQHYGPCLVDPSTGLLHCQRAYPLVFPADQLGALPRAYQHSAGIVSAAPAPTQPLPAHLHAFTYPTAAAHWSPSWPTVLQPPPCGTPGPKPMTPPTVYMPQPDLGLTQQTYHTLPSLYQYQPGYAYQAYPTAVIPQVFAQPYPICQPLYHSNTINPDGRQSTGVSNNLNSYTDVTSTLMQQHQTNSYYNQNRRNSHSGVKNYDNYKSKFNENSAMKSNKGFGTSGSISGSSRTTPLGGQYTPPVSLTDVTFSQNEQIESERNRNNAYAFNNKTYYHNNMPQNNNVTSSYISPYGVTDHQQSNINNDSKYVSNVKKNEGLISPRHYHKSMAAARNANNQNVNEKNITTNFDSCCQYRSNASNAFIVTNDVNARRKAFRNNSGRSQNSVHRQDLHSQRIAMENMIKSFTETRLNQNSGDQKAQNPNDVHQRFAVLQKSFSVDGTPPPVANSNVKAYQRLQSSGSGVEGVDSGNNGKAHNQGDASIPNHAQSDYRPNPSGTKPFCNKYNSRPASSDNNTRMMAPPCGTSNQIYVENYGGKVNGHVGGTPNVNSRPLPKEDQNHESNKKLETPHQTTSSSAPPSKNAAAVSSGNASPSLGTNSVPMQTPGGANASGAKMQSEKDDRLAQVDTPTSKNNPSTPPRVSSTQALTCNNNNSNSNYSSSSYSNKQQNQEYHPPANYRGVNSYSSYGPYRPSGAHSYGGRPGGRGHQHNAHAALHSVPPHPPPAQPVMQHLQNLSLQYGRQFLFARQMSAGWSRRSPGPVPTGFTSHLRYNGPRGPRYNSHGQHRR